MVTLSSPHTDRAPRLPGNEVAATTVRLLLTVSFLVVAHAAALALYYGLGFEHLQAVFLLPVLAAALTFGVWYGFVAALGAVAAYGYLIDPTQFGLRLDMQQDLLNLLLFLGAAWIAGIYTDVVGRRRRTTQTLLEAGQALSIHAEGPALGRIFRGIADQSGDGWRSRAFSELRHAAGAAAITLGAIAIAGLAARTQNHTLAFGTLLSGVVVTGGLFGARFGFIGAIACAFGSILLATAQPAQVGDSVQYFLIAVLFCGLGGWVGAMADRMRDDRKAIGSLLRTGPNLAVAADEAAVREILFSALSTAVRTRLVRLSDETGKVHHDTVGGSACPVVGLEHLPPNDTVQIGAWRIRRMSVEGRDVGVATWKAREAKGGDHNSIDEIVAAIADLGASAIARSRLTVEKAEMEFVARTEQLRTILLDAVSHHFRTPLTSIMGATTSLLEQGPQHDLQARRDFLLIIKEQANRLNRYVENFLSVARLESGSIEIRPRDVVLEPFLYDVWESFGEAGGAKRFFDVEMQDVTVRADPVPLKQVLGNVLENAIKFSAEGSVIRVRGRVEGSSAVLEISDEGPGVSPDDLTRIFERFFRSSRAKAPGLGLGLYITKSLVELMGGAIIARRREDRQGLTMSITLPLSEGQR